MLHQIIYASALGHHEDPACLRDILSEASAHNARNHVTGMLLFVNGSFMQVLEGAPDELQKLYARIEQDPRHAKMVKLLETEIPERQFAAWSMGYASMDSAELDRICGTNDFFRSGHCLTELDAGVTRRVLDEFRSGKWRRQLEDEAS